MTLGVGYLSKIWSQHGGKFKTDYSTGLFGVGPVQYLPLLDKVTAVEHNFSLFRSLLEAYPYKPPKKKILKSAIKLSDDTMQISEQNRNSPGQFAWVPGQSEHLFSHWSFIWTCYRRSPLLSKSSKMQKLKEILHAKHGVLQPPAIDDEEQEHVIESEDESDEGEESEEENDEDGDDEVESDEEEDGDEEFKKKPAAPEPSQTLASPKCMQDLNFQANLLQTKAYDGPRHRQASRAYKRPAASTPVLKKPAASKPALDIIDVEDEDEFDYAVLGMYTRLGPPVLCHSSFDILRANKRESTQVGKRLVLIHSCPKAGGKQLVQLTGGQCGAYLRAGGDVLLYAARLGHNKAELHEKKIQLLTTLN